MNSIVILYQYKHHVVWCVYVRTQLQSGLLHMYRSKDKTQKSAAKDKTQKTKHTKHTKHTGAGMREIHWPSLTGGAAVRGVHGGVAVR